MIIVDGGGSAKCALWEENIGNLKGVLSTEKLCYARVRQQIFVHG